MGISEQVVKPATQVVGFFLPGKAGEGALAMDQQNITLMAALFGFLGVPFLLLYVRQKRRASRLPWKSLPLCCFIVCGMAFAAAFFLGRLTDAVFYALAYAFQLDRETAAMAARVAVNLTAISAASLAGLWVVRKIVHSAPTI